MLKILHGADFHLDSPFSGLAPEQAAQRRQEQRQLLGRLARLAGCCCHTERVAVQSLVRRIAALMGEVGIPRKLAGEELRACLLTQLDEVANLALQDRCTAGNPRSATPEQVKEIYRTIL